MNIKNNIINISNDDFLNYTKQFQQKITLKI